MACGACVQARGRAGGAGGRAGVRGVQSTAVAVAETSLESHGPLPVPLPVPGAGRGATRELRFRTAPALVHIALPPRFAAAETAVLVVELAEGRNRQIRRLCQRSGLPVLSLRRVALGPLHPAPGRRGAARVLSEAEVTACYAAAGMDTAETPAVLPLPLRPEPPLLTREACEEAWAAAGARSA